MRLHIRNFVERAAAAFDLTQPVLEIGSFQVPGQEVIADIRPFFNGKTFIGADMREGPGVDRIENVEHLSFENASIGTVILLDTLEHVKDPIRAMKEVERVLMPDGFVLFTSVMDFPVHDYPFDYWRFTPEAFHLLGEIFPMRSVISWGNPIHPHTLMSIACKSGKADSFRDQMLGIVRGLPQLEPLTLRRRIKLLAARKLRMHETFQKLIRVNHIECRTVVNDQVLDEGVPLEFSSTSAD